KVTMRPFDVRFCYYTTIRPVWTETRPKLVPQAWPGNGWLVTRRRGVASPEGMPFSFVRMLGMQHGLSTDAYYVPIRLKERAEGIGNGGMFDTTHANLSTGARAYLDEPGLRDPDTD